MNRNAPVTISDIKLHSVIQDIQDYTADNGALPDKRLVTVLDAYLGWNGIIGFTAQILAIVEAAKG